MPPRRSAAEFPNDNPELHDGLVWVCSDPCAKALPTLRLRPSERARARLLQPSWVAPLEPSPESGVVLREPADVLREPADVLGELAGVFGEEPAEHVSEAEPVSEEVLEPPPTAFEAFVIAMVRVAMDEGASRAASLLPGMLGLAPFEALPLGHPSREPLEKQGILSPGSGRLSPAFSRLAAGFWGLLEGGSSDLSALGNSTLDGFGAELLTALVPGATGGRERLRRALRKHGVAAFGMLAVA